MRLSGKIALVTGAGTGIGQGIAVELARQGASVAIHYNSSDSGARVTQQRIEELGGQSFLVQANIGRREEIHRMVQQVAEHFGTIDILVNNAALQLNYDFFEYDDNGFDRLMNVNLLGYWQCTQAVIPYMKANNRGRVINISSVHSKRPTDFDVVYAMTKGGIRMLGRESAIELGKYNITVNTIEPGAVDVGRQGNKETKSIYPEDVTEEAAQKNRTNFRRKFPMGRVGLPTDVAGMVCYIASDESVFMSGAAVRMDGSSVLL